MKPLALSLLIPVLFAGCASHPQTTIVGRASSIDVPAEFAAGYAEGINKQLWSDYWHTLHDQSLRGARQ